MNKLHTLKETIEIINSGQFISIAGDHTLLEKLPKGNWIGATTPYFMDDKGQQNLEKLFINKVHHKALKCNIVTYGEDNLLDIANDRFDNGYTLLILPPFSKVHLDYAFKASQLSNLYDTPIVGWMAGTNLDNPSAPKIFNGFTGECYEDKGIAMHVELPVTLTATLEIINIQKEKKNSPTVEFLKNDFSVTDCLIDGNKHNLSDYIFSNNIDIKPPLISDYAGAKINVSFKNIDNENKIVHFYAPVFENRKYYFGSPIENYASEFENNAPVFESNPEFCCNCILNYLYGELENKFLGAPGPITFGEIGYILLNQTLTYLTIIEE